MCDIIYEFCNVCSEHMKKIDNIYFSNENTYDIIFNKETTQYNIYHNFSSNDIYSIKTVAEKKGFSMKEFKENVNKIMYDIIIVEKNNIIINLHDIKKIPNSNNPYKNIMFGIIKKNLYIHNKGNFNEITDMKNMFDNKKEECIKLIETHECDILDFVYMFIRWEHVHAFLIIDNFIKKCSEKKYKKEMILHYGTNIDLVMNFLTKLDEIKDGISMWAKLSETKFHALNQILFLKKHIRFYDYPVKTMREYLKFVCFSKYIDISEEYSKYYIKNHINKDVKPDIKITNCIIGKVELINKKYSVTSKLDTIASFKECDDSINDDPFLKQIESSSLKYGLKIFYQILYSFFYKDPMNGYEILKYAYLCKKCDYVSGQFKENVNIINAILDKFEYKNRIDNDNFIYKLFGNTTAINFGFKCNCKLDEIKKSGGNILNIYDFQNLHYLLLEQVYLNKFEGCGENEEDFKVYDKMLHIITEKLVNEKTTRMNYLRTGITKNKVIFGPICGEPAYEENDLYESDDSDDSDDDKPVIYDNIGAFCTTDYSDEFEEELVKSEYDSDEEQDSDEEKDIDDLLDDSSRNDIYLNHFLQRLNIDITTEPLDDKNSDILDENDNMRSMSPIIPTAEEFELKENIIEEEMEEELDQITDKINELETEKKNKKKEILDIKISIVKNLLKMPNFERKLVEDINDITIEEIDKIIEYYKK